MHKNRLRALPPSLGRLALATRFSCYENQLTAIPPELLAGMTALQEL